MLDARSTEPLLHALKSHQMHSHAILEDIIQKKENLGDIFWTFHALSESDNALQWAAWALGRIADESSVHPLLDALFQDYSFWRGRISPY